MFMIYVIDQYVLITTFSQFDIFPKRIKLAKHI